MRCVVLLLVLLCLLQIAQCKRGSRRNRNKDRQPIINREEDDNDEDPEVTTIPSTTEELELEMEGKRAFDFNETITYSPEMIPNTTYYPLTPQRPGFRARVTQKGFDFAAQFATDFLTMQMKKFQVPDVEKDVANTHVSVTNIHVVEFPEPKNEITILENQGLRWETWQMQPTFAADYSATMGFGFFSVEKNGNVTVYCSDMRFKLDFIIDRDPLNGRPFILTTNCEASGEVTIVFQGEWSGMLNTGSSVMQSYIRDTIMDQICTQATNEIDVNMQSELHTLPMVETVGDLLDLDFTFTEFPSFKQNYIETSHRGVVYYTPDPQLPPFQPPVIPRFGKHRQRMMYLYVTDYVVNSGLYAAFRTGQMSFNVTEDIRHMVPADALAILNTICLSPDVCIGSVFPQIARMYPPRLLAEVDMYAVAPPRVHFIRGTKAQMFTYSEAVFFIKHDDATRSHLFTARVNVTSAVAVKVNGSRVSFTIKDVKPTAIVTESNIGDVEKGQAFQKLLKIGAEKFIMQQLAVHAEKGFELPKTDDVRFENSVILRMKGRGLVVVATDIFINPDMDLQGMIEEQQQLALQASAAAAAAAAAAQGAEVTTAEPW